MSELRDTQQIVREDLLPLVVRICDLVGEEGAADQEAFFGRIRTGLEHIREVDDLAGPFMELSTSAFHGFAFSPEVTFLLDRVLVLAQTLSHTLSAPADEMQ